jgi:mannose PTS system EIIA component
VNEHTADTGLVILTHGDIGRSMLEVAEFILEQSLASVRVISFQQSAMKETADDEIQAAIDQANLGSGVLVMTDVGGASPCNYATRLRSSADVAVVSGLNLAMLIRVWNYRHKPVRQLVNLAIEGAVRDIREFTK